MSKIEQHLYDHQHHYCNILLLINITISTTVIIFIIIIVINIIIAGINIICAFLIMMLMMVMMIMMMIMMMMMMMIICLAVSHSVFRTAVSVTVFVLYGFHHFACLFVCFLNTLVNIDSSSYHHHYCCCCFCCYSGFFFNYEQQIILIKLLLRLPSMPGLIKQHNFILWIDTLAVTQCITNVFVSSAALVVVFLSFQTLLGSLFTLAFPS